MGKSLAPVTVNSFYGIINRLEDESIKRGSASDALNWHFLGDHIELRRGQTLMGTNVAGTGRITGLYSASKVDSGQVLFSTYDRKVKYYDSVLEDFVETDTADVLPLLAATDDVAIDQYQGIGGSFVYLSSANSSIYKIPVSNPGSIVDLSSTSHRGKIKIKMNRTRLWGRKDTAGGSDPTGHYLSYLDKDELSDFTPVVAESIGSAGSTTYSGTLVFKSGQPKRTCMYLTVQATVGAGTETFRDQRNGTLLSNFGSTGTVNYATGAYSVTFSSITLSGVTADYYWEDSTSGGIADFSKSTPRTAGQGAVFRQDDGLDHQNMGTIGSHDYCFHTSKTYDMFISSDDTDATNLPFRTGLGIPYWRALSETEDGIYYVDAIDVAEPAIRLLQPSDLATDAPKPKSISDNINLSDYRFDYSVVQKWGKYVINFCRDKNSTVNDTMWSYHNTWKSWERHSVRAGVSTVYNGMLVVGDSASNNVFEVFSGLTDEDVEIPNYVIFNRDHLGSPETTKYTNIFEIRGLIQDDQLLELYLAYDGADFVKVGEIDGNGPYVDHNQRVTVGSTRLGEFEVGGGGSGIEASPYRHEFRINTPRLETLRLKIVATRIGYVSVSHYGFKDIRVKARSLPVQYL